MLASVASMIDQFNMSNIEILRDQGYEVHVAANFEDGNTSSKQRIEEFKNELHNLGIPFYHVDFARDIKKVFKNFKAYRRIRDLILEHNYEFVHCHSPIGGVCGRLAALRTKTKVIYTAHGFHFFKGAPLINWLLYYPIERWLARYTDVLITINKEDYVRAKNFKAKKVEYIPGVGLDTKKFENITVNKKEKRKELGLPEDAIVLLSVGELNKNKNHETTIKGISKLGNKKLIYLICGSGPLEQYLKDLASSLDTSSQVRLLGFRTDVGEINKASDIFVFPSFREGLPVALMEAMAAGLPIVCSDIRGNRDLIEDGKGGYLVKPDDVDGFANAIQKLLEDEELRSRMGMYNKESVLRFELKRVLTLMEEIYANVL